MPCNARVVINAKVKVNASEVLKIANELGIPVKETVDKFEIGFGPASVEFDKEGNAVLRYRGDSWDEGVAYLRRVASYLQRELGVDFHKVGEPETHIHDKTAPWQRTRA